MNISCNMASILWCDWDLFSVSSFIFGKGLGDRWPYAVSPQYFSTQKGFMGDSIAARCPGYVAATKAQIIIPTTMLGT